VELEAEILTELKKVEPLQTKLKCFVLNSYLLEDKQLNVELEAELALINLKYKNLTKPLLERSNEIVKGSVPTEEELKGIHAYMTEEET